MEPEDPYTRRQSVLKLNLTTSESTDHTASTTTTHRISRRVSFNKHYRVLEFCKDVVPLDITDVYERDPRVTDTSSDSSAVNHKLSRSSMDLSESYDSVSTKTSVHMSMTTVADYHHHHRNSQEPADIDVPSGNSGVGGGASGITESHRRSSVLHRMTQFEHNNSRHIRTSEDSVTNQTERNKTPLHGEISCPPSPPSPPSSSHNVQNKCGDDDDEMMELTRCPVSVDESDDDNGCVMDTTSCVASTELSAPVSAANCGPAVYRTEPCLHDVSCMEMTEAVPCAPVLCVGSSPAAAVQRETPVENPEPADACGADETSSGADDGMSFTTAVTAPQQLHLSTECDNNNSMSFTKAVGEAIVNVEACHGHSRLNCSGDSAEDGMEMTCAVPRVLAGSEVAPPNIQSESNQQRGVSELSSRASLSAAGPIGERKSRDETCEAAELSMDFTEAVNRPYIESTQSISDCSVVNTGAIAVTGSGSSAVLMPAISRLAPGTGESGGDDSAMEFTTAVVENVVRASTDKTAGDSVISETDVVATLSESALVLADCAEKGAEAELTTDGMSITCAADVVPAVEASDAVTTRSEDTVCANTGAENMSITAPISVERTAAPLPSANETKQQQADGSQSSVAEADGVSVSLCVESDMIGACDLSAGCESLKAAAIDIELSACPDSTERDINETSATGCVRAESSVQAVGEQDVVSKRPFVRHGPAGSPAVKTRRTVDDQRDGHVSCNERQSAASGATVDPFSEPSRSRDVSVSSETSAERTVSSVDEGLAGVVTTLEFSADSDHTDKSGVFAATAESHRLQQRRSDGADGCDTAVEIASSDRNGLSSGCGSGVVSQFDSATHDETQSDSVSAVTSQDDSCLTAASQLADISFPEMTLADFDHDNTTTTAATTTSLMLADHSRCDREVSMSVQPSCPISPQLQQSRQLAAAVKKYHAAADAREKRWNAFVSTQGGQLLSNWMDSMCS